VPSLLIATTNRDKIREIVAVLGDLPLTLRTLDEFPAIPAPEETGRTFAENARAKARYYAHATSQTTVAEDSGLVVDALGGAPGVESARYGGADASYSKKFALIYDALRAGCHDGSAARFVCALAVVRDGRILFEAEGTIEGRVALQPAGDGGFGYDPIFYYPPFAATLAQVAERKAEVSHRARAFRALRDYLLTA
jgi:XTP/dITP diphosphohydrolase